MVFLIVTRGVFTTIRTTSPCCFLPKSPETQRKSAAKVLLFFEIRKSFLYFYAFYRFFFRFERLTKGTELTDTKRITGTEHNLPSTLNSQLACLRAVQQQSFPGAQASPPAVRGLTAVRCTQASPPAFKEVRSPGRTIVCPVCAGVPACYKVRFNGGGRIDF